MRGPPDVAVDSKYGNPNPNAYPNPDPNLSPSPSPNPHPHPHPGKRPTFIEGATEDDGDGGGGGGSGVRGGRVSGASAAGGEQQLLRLAESQRMNTDVRRGIFVAIMGSDDYVDAHTRVLKLRLKKGQQPEIVRVLLECCGQEGAFNRFYALLGVRLCETYREVRFALHFAFWDLFKQLADLTLHRAANSAKLLANLAHRAAVPITVLKVRMYVRMHAYM